MNRYKALDIITIEFEKSATEYFIWILVYIPIFLIAWLSLNEDVGNGKIFTIVYMFVIPFWEILCDARNVFEKSKNNKRVNDIIEFLPITTKEKLFGKFVREFRSSLSLIIPYISLYIIPVKNYNAQGLRGEILIITSIIILWSCIKCVANYDKKYEVLKMFLGAFTFIAIILVSIDIVSNIGIYKNIIFRELGNFYIGIIVGLIFVISIYYVNLKCIKLHRVRRENMA